jgi:predicted small metal-binding protein
VSGVAENLKKVECDPTCGFMVRSHDEKELVEIVTKHAKKAHNMTITEKDAKGMIKPA